MKTTNKIVSLTVLLTVLISLSACFGAKDEIEEKSSVPPTKPSTTEETEEPAEKVTGATFSFVVNNDNVKIGDEVNVDIKLNANKNDIASASLYVRYDDKFDIVKITPSSLFDVWIKNDILKEQHLIELVAGKIPPAFSSEDTFATITLKAKSIGEGKINIDTSKKTEIINTEYKNVFDLKNSPTLTINIESSNINNDATKTENLNQSSVNKDKEENKEEKTEEIKSE